MKARLTIPEETKEELFAEFMLRMAEMDREDRKLSAAKNRHALNGVSKYWHDVWEEFKESEEARDEHGCFKYYGGYQAYVALRKVIPVLVNAKFYGGVIGDRHTPGKPLEDEDMDEATKAGKYLIDAMFAYLKEGSGEKRE